MSDTNADIRINIDTSEALANLKNLQRQISLFQQEMARSGNAANQQAARNIQTNLINNLNATGQYRAQIKSIQSETEHFTEQLEKNKFSVGQYFRYAGAATKSFGKIWKSEFDTIEKVATERVKTLQTQYIKLGRDANGALKSIAIRPLALDMDNLSTKMQIAAQKQQLLNQLLKQGSTAMLNWGKNTQWAGRQLMVGFTVPLTMAGTAAAKAYIEFEKAAIQFKRVYGDFNTTSKDVEQMASKIKDLANEFTKYGVAVADTMKMAADAAAQGKTGADLLAQVTQANRLAVLGNIDQAKSLETLTSITSTFGVATEDLAGSINFLNSVENQTITSIDDLTTAIPKAGPVVKQLGGDVKDLAFFLTAMREGGIDAGEGANALKSGLASIINPSKAASDMLNGFGINLRDIVNKNAGNLTGTVFELAKSLDTLAPLDRSRAIEQLFGKFQFARMSTLFQNIVKDGSQANRVLEMTKMSTEELAVLSERELKKVESSPAFKFDKAMKDLQTKLIPVGEAFIKAITPVVEWVGKILDGFNNMGEGAKQFATIATIAVAGIGPAALMAFGLIANGVANLIKMFASIKSFFNGTRGSTTDLTQTTEYMTQAQLEAQSVASSLEQAHARLTQEFTVEASAIQNLVIEYERAIAAQTRLAGGAAAGLGRKMATGGIVRGPGGPTDDAVPTNLSNGEAVIPAASVKKNPGIVSALIAGNKINIPGYFDGVVLPGQYAADMGNAARRRASISQNVENLTSRGFGPQAQQAVDELVQFGASAGQARQLLGHLNIAAKDGEGAVSAWIEALRQNAAETKSGTELIRRMKESTGVGLSGVTTNFTHIGGGATYIDQNGQQQTVKSQLGFANFDAAVNRKLAKGGASTGEFVDAFDAAGMEKWNHSIEMGGGKVEELAADIQLLDQKIKEIITGSGATKVFDLESDAKAFGPGAISVQSAYAQARAGMAGSPLISALDASAAIPRELRQNGAGTNLPRGFNKNEASTFLASAYQNEMGISPVQDGIDDAKQYADAKNAELDKPQNDPYVQSRDRNSPHRLAGPDGQDDARAYYEGFKSLPTPPGITPPPGSGIVPPATSSATPQPQNNGLFGKLKGVAGTAASKIGSAAKQVGSAVYAKADQAFSTYMEGVYAEEDRKADIRKKQFIGLLEEARLNDAEYAAAEAKREKFIQLAQSGKTLSKEEEAEYQAALAAIEKKKLMISEQLNTNNMENGGSGGAGGTTTTPTTKKQRAQKIGQTIGKAAMIGTTIAAVGSMMPGPIGQVSQQAMPLLGAFSMLSQFIQGPTSAALVGLVALIGAIAYGVMQYNAAIDKGIDKSLELGEAMGTSTKAIKGFAEFAGRATASEVMDKKRSSMYSPYASAPGKTTFGENFVQSETGKALLKTIMSSSSGDKTLLSSNMKSQLSTAVMSGAITASEARSIAVNIGKQINDVGLGIRVSADLSELLGPNGENILTDGLTIRTKLMEESRQNISSTVATNNKNLGFTGKEFGDTSLGAVGGLAAGAIGGAIIGSVIPGVGTAVGAIVGGIVGGIGAGIAGGFMGAQGHAERLGRMAGATVAMTMNALDQQKQLLDSLDLDYQKRIDTAKAAGDTAKAEQLQNQYIKERQGLLAENKKTQDAIVNSFKNSGYQNEMLSGAEKAVTKKYKDTANEDIAATALDRIKGVSNTTQRYQLELMLGTSVDPMQMLALTDIMGTDEASISKVLNINANLGGDAVSQISNIAGMFVDASGKPVQSVQKDFIARMSSVTDTKEADNLKTLYSELAKGSQIYDVSVMVDYVSKNPQIEAQMIKNIDNIKELKGKKLTVDIVQKASIANPEAMKIIKDDQAYFDTIKTKEQQQVYLETVMNLQISEPKIDSDAVQGWLASEGSEWNKPEIPNATKIAEYIKWSARKITENTVGDTEFAPGTTKNQNTSGGPVASFLDDIVKRLRDASKWQQRLTTGWSASYAAIKKFTDKSISNFDGLQERLKKFGADKTFIAAVIGADESDVKKVEQMGAKALKALIKTYKKLMEKEIGVAWVLMTDTERRDKYIERYNNALELIGFQEDEINKKFDKRKEALDTIAKLNDRLAQQQQGQLSLADALSKGDIGAAARAIQDIRSQNSQFAMQDAQDALEKARQNALEKITTSVNGVLMTRKDIEAKILDLNKQNVIAKQEDLDKEIALGEAELKRYEARNSRNSGSGGGSSDGSGGGKQTQGDKDYAAKKDAGFGKKWKKVNGHWKTVDVNQPTVYKVGVGVVPDDSYTWNTDKDQWVKKRSLVQVSGRAYYATGGLVKTRYFADGDFVPMGTDTVPAMLTPGEYVINRAAVQSFGADNLKAINNGSAPNGDSVYNYSISVNVSSNSDANEIARVVMDQIRRIDSQQLRGNRY